MVIRDSGHRCGIPKGQARSLPRLAHVTGYHSLAGPFFFHGFLRPISGAREIENDAFHSIHGHFKG